MDILIKRFIEHVSLPRPGFECFPAGAGSNPATFTTTVTHVLKPSADEPGLAVLKQCLGAAATDFERFYEHFDGAVLYRDTIPFVFQGEDHFAAGLELFPIREWDTQTRDFRDDFEFLTEDEAGDDFEVPKWYEAGVAFGTLPRSGNYLVISTSPESIGQIFLADHDDFLPEPLAPSLPAFLAALIDNPAKYPHERGCHLRLRDGKTDLQWIPRKFLSRER